jgi:hypothetical protein
MGESPPRNVSGSPLPYVKDRKVPQKKLLCEVVGFNQQLHNNMVNVLEREAAAAKYEELTPPFDSSDTSYPDESGLLDSWLFHNNSRITSFKGNVCTLTIKGELDWWKVKYFKGKSFDTEVFIDRRQRSRDQRIKSGYTGPPPNPPLWKARQPTKGWWGQRCPSVLDLCLNSVTIGRRIDEFIGPVLPNEPDGFYRNVIVPVLYDVVQVEEQDAIEPPAANDSSVDLETRRQEFLERRLKKHHSSGIAKDEWRQLQRWLRTYRSGSPVYAKGKWPLFEQTYVPRNEEKYQFFSYLYHGHKEFAVDDSERLDQWLLGRDAHNSPTYGASIKSFGIRSTMLERKMQAYLLVLNAYERGKCSAAHVHEFRLHAFHIPVPAAYRGFTLVGSVETRLQHSWDSKRLFCKKLQERKRTPFDPISYSIVERDEHSDLRIVEEVQEAIEKVDAVRDGLESLTNNSVVRNKVRKAAEDQEGILPDKGEYSPSTIM